MGLYTTIHPCLAEITFSLCSLQQLLIPAAALPAPTNDSSIQVAKYDSKVTSTVAQQVATGSIEVILTSYAQLRVHAEEVADMQPHAVIFDEVINSHIAVNVVF